MRDLTVDDIVALNAAIVRTFGGHVGVQNAGNLYFAVSRSESTEDPYKKAAYLMHDIARGHPFLDGNKRTAFESAKYALDRNGITISPTTEEKENFLVRLASDESINLQEVEKWLRSV